MKNLHTVYMLSCLALCFSGCNDKSDPSMKPEESGPLTVSLILGKWTRRTTPELADSRSTMTFLKSGEFQGQLPVEATWKSVTAEVDEVEEKKGIVPWTVSGAWEVEGDKLVVRVTEHNVPSFDMKEPMEWKIVSLTEKRLELHGRGERGKYKAFFRDE